MALNSITLQHALTKHPDILLLLAAGFFPPLISTVQINWDLNPGPLYAEINSDHTERPICTIYRNKYPAVVMAAPIVSVTYTRFLFPYYIWYAWCSSWMLVWMGIDPGIRYARQRSVKNVRHN
ncbi:hypothetical protein BGX38DRAFT_591176 [Terfezia claveryi]|nr:hypothetical protein BGX38DRAFT_591176 [Terfezia claveryi]